MDRIERKGVIFKKEEIFYGDRLQSEWGRWGYYWWRLFLAIFALYRWSIILSLLWLYLLFFRAKPWNRLLLVSKGKIIWEDGAYKLFSYGCSWSLSKEAVVDVEIFLSKGEVHIFKKRIFSERGEVAELQDIGRVWELAELLKKYEYPVVIYE